MADLAGRRQDAGQGQAGLSRPQGTDFKGARQDQGELRVGCEKDPRVRRIRTFDSTKKTTPRAAEADHRGSFFIVKLSKIIYLVRPSPVFPVEHLRFRWA